MAKVLPFRGIFYDRNKVPNLDLVVTQPYDKIDAALQEQYYERHPHNIVQVTRGKDLPGDNDAENKYVRAGRTLDAWLREGVLVRDARPALYAYFQTFAAASGGPPRTRKGFVALGVLAGYDEGVHAHEKTLLAPKTDRMNLMRAAQGVTCGHIFMLYSDPERAVNALLDAATAGPADLEAHDDFGETHRLWRIVDPATIGRVQAAMADKEVVIADGHHRYEVALQFRDEMRAKGLRYDGNETPEARMMTFVAFDDPGLLILPTHRLVKDVAGFSAPELLAGLRRTFEVAEYPFPSLSAERRARTEFLKDLKVGESGRHRLGCAVQGMDRYYLLTLKNESVLDAPLPGNPSAACRRLDVSILHSLILEPLLGLSADKVEREQHLSYKRHAEDALDLVQDGESQAAFLLNPTRLEQVRAISTGGERMPQKSTDFYPKLLSGLVLNRLSIVP
ncbi:MAG: DUF1015 domain-containing protein [Planctomycetes bacterium]|nr:DUF1015 domain-containing protein [Planctomycetota bacterium]